MWLDAKNKRNQVRHWRSAKRSFALCCRKLRNRSYLIFFRRETSSKPIKASVPPHMLVVGTFGNEAGTEGADTGVSLTDTVVGSTVGTGIVVGLSPLRGDEISNVGWGGTVGSPRFVTTRSGAPIFLRHAFSNW